MPESTAQETRFEFYKSGSMDVDKLGIEKVQDTKAKGAINKKELQHEKTILLELKQLLA